MNHIRLHFMLWLILLTPISGYTQTSQQDHSDHLEFIDISLDALFSVGGSTANDNDLSFLQGGGHDPKLNGFNVQSVEVSLTGAVDHYFAGEAHILFGVNTKTGTSFLEIEEVFFNTLSVPYGLSFKGGIYLTDIGRTNPYHVHSWNWQDQPVINSRVLGPDGMRGVGLQMNWLLPTDWFSEFVISAQNALGETMVSFLGSEESTIGGQNPVDRDVNGLNDFVFALRWANGWDFSDAVGSKLGTSFIVGPNSAGENTFTQIYGADFVLKWTSLNATRGWPFFTWETEFLLRNYHVDATVAESPLPFINTSLVNLGGTLSDWGFYSQALYGFHPRWAAGCRFEAATGNESTLGFREFDPLRDDRVRVSPLLAFYPSEFSRLRLQYNVDRATHLDELFAHSFWFGIEFLYGAHPAHDF